MKMLNYKHAFIVLSGYTASVYLDEEYFYAFSKSFLTCFSVHPETV